MRQCLERGCRGLPGGESLLKLLAQFRGKRLECDRPRVTVEQILTWANVHHERVGRWPTRDSGPIHGVPDEKWSRLMPHSRGTRGLPGGLSLSKLLAGHLEIRAPLTVEKILAWVDEHYRRFGQWPHVKSGEVQGVSGLTWCALNQASSEAGVAFLGVPRSTGSSCSTGGYETPPPT